MFDEALAVCKTLARAEIWIELHPDTQTLMLGPTARVQAHPELLQQVRTQKSHILEALQETLAYEVMGSPETGRFQVEACPACQQTVFVITAPRRLAVHRTPDGRTVPWRCGRPRSSGPDPDGTLPPRTLCAPPWRGTDLDGLTRWARRLGAGARLALATQ